MPRCFVATGHVSTGHSAVLRCNRPALIVINIVRPDSPHVDDPKALPLLVRREFFPYFGFGRRRQPTVAVVQELLDRGGVLLHLYRPSGSLTELSLNPFLHAVSSHNQRQLCFSVSRSNSYLRLLLGQPWTHTTLLSSGHQYSLPFPAVCSPATAACHWLCLLLPDCIRHPLPIVVYLRGFN